MKAVICGAGIAGLALAQRLDAHGWQVVLLERAAGPRAQGYMIDFFGPGYDATEAMGVLPRIQELGHQVDEMAYRDETGRRRAGLSFEQFARSVGGRLVSIMRPDLERALREHLPDRVDLRFSTSLTGVENDTDGVRVSLSTGESLDADVLIGADGIHSTVRRLVFGEERRYLRYLGFHTAAYVFEDAEIHARIGGEFCLTDTVGRQMGFYGLRGGSRVATFLVHRTPDPALPGDFRDAIRQEYGSLGWIVPRALATCPPSDQIYYDQVAQIVMPSWHQGRTVLIGDACSAVSVLAGQGASLGITGAFVLGEQLAQAGRRGGAGTATDAGRPNEAGDTVTGALAEYERLMRPVVADKQQAARRGARWFVPSSPTQLRVRRAALRLSRLPGVDRLVAATVSGKSTALVTNLARAGRDAPVVAH